MITFNDNSEKIPYEITQRYCEATNDSHWYMDESLFKDDAYLKNGKSEYNFLANLQALISQGGPLLSLKDMGFPDNWKHLGVWK